MLQTDSTSKNTSYKIFKKLGKLHQLYNIALGSGWCNVLKNRIGPKYCRKCPKLISKYFYRILRQKITQNTLIIQIFSEKKICHKNSHNSPYFSPNFMFSLYFVEYTSDYSENFHKYIVFDCEFDKST